MSHDFLATPTPDKKRTRVVETLNYHAQLLQAGGSYIKDTTIASIHQLLIDGYFVHVTKYQTVDNIPGYRVEVIQADRSEKSPGRLAYKYDVQTPDHNQVDEYYSFKLFSRLHDIDTYSDWCYIDQEEMKDITKKASSFASKQAEEYADDLIDNMFSQDGIMDLARALASMAQSSGRVQEALGGRVQDATPDIFFDIDSMFRNN